MMNTWLPARPERGSATIEAAIGVPAFMLFVLLIIAGGRVAIAHQAVQAAATDAARAASLTRTSSVAHRTGSAAAARSLSNQQLACTANRVAVDTAGFDKPVGVPAQVTATVTCVVNVSDLSLPGVPGSYTVTETMSSPIDTYRER